MLQHSKQVLWIIVVVAHNDALAYPSCEVHQSIVTVPGIECLVRAMYSVKFDKKKKI